VKQLAGAGQATAVNVASGSTAGVARASDGAEALAISTAKVVVQMAARRLIDKTTIGFRQDPVPVTAKLLISGQ
jgi:hypothetical protein